MDSFLPRINPSNEEVLVRYLLDKVKKDAKTIIKYELYGDAQQADVVVISYGSESRSVRAAIKKAWVEGMKVAMIRLITVWPFPKDLLKELDREGRTFMVAEINAGQIRTEVERYVKKGEVIGLHLMGGRIHSPDEVLQAIERNV
jgi:2-oxoglutarate ferredoxin oxidoreductase subunit alpha